MPASFAGFHATGLAFRAESAVPFRQTKDSRNVVHLTTPAITNLRREDIFDMADALLGKPLDDSRGVLSKL